MHPDKLAIMLDILRIAMLMMIHQSTWQIPIGSLCSYTSYVYPI